MISTFFLTSHVLSIVSQFYLLNTSLIHPLLFIIISGANHFLSGFPAFFITSFLHAATRVSIGAQVCHGALFKTLHQPLIAPGQRDRPLAWIFSGLLLFHSSSTALGWLPLHILHFSLQSFLQFPSPPGMQPCAASKVKFWPPFLQKVPHLPG